jgi:hypothetical protein
MRTTGEQRQHLRHQRKRQQRGDPDVTPQRSERRFTARVDLGALGLGRLPDARSVAGAADRGDEFVDACARRIEAHRGAFGREVDRGLRPGHAVQHLLDADRAGGTGHALDGQVGMLQRLAGRLAARPDRFDDRRIHASHRIPLPGIRQLPRRGMRR